MTSEQREEMQYALGLLTALRYSELDGGRADALEEVTAWIREKLDRIE